MSLGSATPLVEAEGLAVTAAAGGLRVEGLAFRLEAPGALVLVGPVEAASAVLRVVLGIDRADAGAVRVLGEAPGSLPRDRAAAVLSRVGFLPRSGALLANLTLRENLLLPLQFHRRLGAAEAERVAAAALARFGLDEAPAHRERDVLARATLLEPELLVLDDPLDDLDEDVAREVVAALTTWSRERPRGLLVASPYARTASTLRALALPLPVTRA